MSITRQAVTRLTLDLGLPNCQTSAAIHKGDKNRRWEITVIDDGKPFLLPDTWTVVLAGVKPDGTSLYNGCVVDDGKIVYDFASGPQIATCEGTFPVQFDVFDEEGELVATPKVWVNCYPTLREQVEDVDSTDEFSAISQFIAEANELRAELDAIENRSDMIFGGVTLTGRKTQTVYVDQFDAKSVVLFLPIDEATRKAAQEAKLEIESIEPEKSGGGYLFTINRNGDTSAGLLIFVTIVIRPKVRPKDNYNRPVGAFVGICSEA